MPAMFVFLFLYIIWSTKFNQFFYIQANVADFLLNKFKNYKYTHKNDANQKSDRNSNGRKSASRKSHIVHKKRSIAPDINTKQHPNDTNNKRKSVRPERTERMSVEQVTVPCLNEAQTNQMTKIQMRTKNCCQSTEPLNKIWIFWKLKTLIVNKKKKTLSLSNQYWFRQLLSAKKWEMNLFFFLWTEIHFAIFAKKLYSQLC